MLVNTPWFACFVVQLYADYYDVNWRENWVMKKASTMIIIV
jgi:hypothetical protein